MVMTMKVTKTQQAQLYPEELPNRSRRRSRKGKGKGKKKEGEDRETGGDSFGRKQQKVKNDRQDGVNVLLGRPLHP